MPVVITSKRHLFRRCGVNHPADATTYPDGRFSAEQLEAMQKEPMLTVDVVKFEEPKESEKTQDPPALPAETPEPEKKKKR